MRPLMLALVGAGAAIMLAGCGSGSPPPSTANDQAVAAPADASATAQPDCLYRIQASTGSVLLDVVQPNTDCESIRGSLNGQLSSLGGVATYADGVTVDTSGGPVCGKMADFGVMGVYADSGDTSSADSFCTGFTGHAPGG